MTTYTGFIGRTDDGDRVFVTIELRELHRPAQTTTHEAIESYTELSITAEAYLAGRALTGDTTRGGQYREAGEDVIAGTIADGLTEDDLTELTELWERWHLNSMTAACAHQTVVWEQSRYGVRPSLERTEECPGVVLVDMPVTAEDYRPAYRYGTAWLVDVMPASVVERVHALGQRIAAVEIEQADDEIETIDEDDAAERYGDYLDGALEEVRVGNLTFDPSRVIRELDPIAFREGMLEWAEMEGIEIA